MAQHKPREQRVKDALKAIRKHRLDFITEVGPMMGISTSRLYQLKIEKEEAVKDALEKNRIAKKLKLRKNWENSENASLQIAMYKLLGTDEEYHRLANTKLDVTTREEVPIFKSIDLGDDESDEQQ